VDVDVASTPAVSYIVKMVQGATRSMLIDHAYLLESHFAHELPETLIGAIRWASVCVRLCVFVVGSLLSEGFVEGALLVGLAGLWGWQAAVLSQDFERMELAGLCGSWDGAAAVGLVCARAGRLGPG
jgi:hypothetical protein